MTRNLKTALLATAAAFAVAACAPRAERPGAKAEAAAPAPQSEAMNDAALPSGAAPTNAFWWPERLDLSPLRQNEIPAPPSKYAAEFAKLDLAAVKQDIAQVLTTSQDWWPADYGNYGPLMIRMAWHSAGTYRTIDGRGGAGGGQQRFEPLNSWPDNANLDKARRLLWPVKRKYGDSLSWADLMILAGNVSLETMGFKTYGFAGGREDDAQAELVNWGPETKWLDDKRYSGDRQLQKPLAAVQMGLIYVNPEGPNGNPDPVAAAKDIRETFARMAMNDEETVALIAGGHTFGKAHGAHKPGDCVGVDPAAESVDKQGLGWANSCGAGAGADTVTSGLEGAWTAAPTAWTSLYLENLFAFEWEQTRSPGGAIQWIPKDGAGAGTVPDAHDPAKTHAPIMLTTDLSLRFDPAYEKIARRFKDDPEAFRLAFAKAWFKLTHRDMGPRARYVGAEVPAEPLIWQDPVPPATHPLVNAAEIASLKGEILSSGLSVPELVRAAWASASTYRDTDMRGGANGARVTLAPQKDWPANDPAELARVTAKLEEIRAAFNRRAPGGRKISLADMIVLGGVAAVEKAAKDGGRPVVVSFAPGRTDATAEMTDAASFAVLKPEADGFRNYYAEAAGRSPAEALIEKADMLGLTVREMTALVGGMRALGANAGGAAHGVFTARPGALTNDFFVNLLDMSTKWAPKEGEPYVFEGRDRKTGDLKWTATEADLVFGSNAELRAVAEEYAYAGAESVLARDFAAAWAKVMNNDRFDLKRKA